MQTTQEAPDSEPVPVAVAQTISLNDTTTTGTDPEAEAADSDEGLDEEEEGAALSSLDSDEDDDGVLEIFKPDCLKCSALVPHVAEFEKIKPKKRECHYTKGNDRCPGSSAKIMQYIDVSGAVRRFKQAHDAQDFMTLSKLYAKLATKSQYEQSKINARLAEVLGR